MKMSFSSILLAEDLDWVYELEDIGFDGWEMVYEGKQETEKIKDIRDSTNLTLSTHAPFSDLNIASVNYPIWEETIRQIRQCIAESAEFVEIVVVHPGQLSPLGAQMPDKAWEQMISALKILCDFGDEYGITIALENMVNVEWIFGRYPKELIGIIETVERDNIGITFDVGHANMTGTIEGFLNLDRDIIRHIHVHDNLGKRDDHLSLGKGIIDWAYVMKNLEVYERIVVVEVRSLAEGRESIDFLSGRDGI